MTDFRASIHATGFPAYTHTFPTAAESVRDARRLAITAVHAWGLEPLAHDAALVTSELATNVVQHAGVPSYRVTVLRLTDTRVRVVVTDTRRSSPPVPPTAGESDECGRGLSLVEAVADTTGCEQPVWGKRLWAELQAPAKALAPHHSADMAMPALSNAASSHELRSLPDGGIVHDRSPLTALAGSTVLVTGGAGLIGSRITARLRALGARPVSLCAMDAYPAQVYTDRFGVDPSDADVITGDVRDTALVRTLVGESDYVIHAAALADVAACTREPMAAIDVNITGTQSVLDAVAATDRVRRMVFVSSASVYGDGNPEETTNPDLLTMRQLLETVHGGRIPPQFHETHAMRPVSVYGNTKVWGEEQTKLVLGQIGTSYSIVRYFSVYGEPQTIKPNSHSWVVAWFATRANLGLPLHLNGGGRQVRDLTHVEDIAEGTLHALTNPRAHTDTLNIGTGIATSVRDVADLVRAHYPDTLLLETPLPAGDPLGGYASVRRMENILGWKPKVAIAEGITRYVRWLEQTPQAAPSWLTQATAL
ncbi:NAD-dependent epimerase/dehydratase family protein [Streptomyces sp. NPDC127084]|uniref:NAD-dependent epimerase/dehydratase family protein n=1 Tax=Streptomyces sp. NPDC127084 TaxID=3347133 RepID=UPI0036461722